MSETKPCLTIFSAPKAFQEPHITNIQKNALTSWKQLGEDLEVILIGNDPGIAEAAVEFQVKHIPEVALNEKGTPLVSSIFDLARKNSTSPFLAYINADILTLPDFLDGLKTVKNIFPRFLIVGQRWDMEMRERVNNDPALGDMLYQKIREHGRLHPQGGSDYFIFPRECFQVIPSFAIGRAGWDNWMIYWARHQGYALVDGTGTINIIHQNHDYRHLPDGQPHYRIPETYENVRLAGGRRTILNLKDTQWDIRGEVAVKKPFTWQRFWRELELFPLVRLHSMVLANAAFAVFHPRKAYREFRTWLAEIRKSRERKNKE